MKASGMKARLQKEQPVFGVIGPSADPAIVEMIGYAGFDFYIIDCEHGMADPAVAETAIHCCEMIGMTPLVRVRGNEGKLVSQFLDAGAMGIVMPHATTVREVRDLVAAVKYPPIGRRGLGPARAADYMMGSMTQVQYVDFANQQTIVLPQFEHIEALDSLEEMTRAEHIDGFIIGPRDLSMSMGFLDGPEHPEVQEVIRKARGIIQRAGLAVGMGAASSSTARRLTDEGVRVCLFSMTNLIWNGARACLPALSSTDGEAGV
jgi:4-hydroxy-2-oxoheptanedioate aldolase